MLTAFSPPSSSPGSLLSSRGYKLTPVLMLPGQRSRQWPNNTRGRLKYYCWHFNGFRHHVQGFFKTSSHRLLTLPPLCNLNNSALADSMPGLPQFGLSVRQAAGQAADRTRLRRRPPGQEAQVRRGDRGPVRRVPQPTDEEGSGPTSLGTVHLHK